MTQSAIELLKGVYQLEAVPFGNLGRPLTDDEDLRNYFDYQVGYDLTDGERHCSLLSVYTGEGIDVDREIAQAVIVALKDSERLNFIDTMAMDISAFSTNFKKGVMFFAPYDGERAPDIRTAIDRAMLKALATTKLKTE